MLVRETGPSKGGKGGEDDQWRVKEDKTRLCQKPILCRRCKLQPLTVLVWCYTKDNQSSTHGRSHRTTSSSFKC